MDSPECPKELLAVKDVLLLRCQPGDIVLIQINVDGMPKQKADDYIKRVCDHFSKILPSQEVQAVAIPADIQVSVIRRENDDNSDTPTKQ